MLSRPTDSRPSGPETVFLKGFEAGGSANPIVTAIVVDHNGGATLGESLASLFAQSLESVEVILVDNGSTDGSAAMAAKTYGDRLVYIRNQKKCGFGEANNQAIERARGEWIFLLNNDAVAAPNLLDALMSVAVTDSTIGMLACRVLVYDRPNVFDSVGLSIYPDGVCRNRGWEEKDCGQYDQVEEVLGPSGSAAAYRRKTLDDVGIFDPAYFAYLEDLDLALLAQFAGWRCVYVPDAVVRHRKSSTFGNYSRFKAYHVERNRIYAAVKFLPRFLLLMSPLFTLIRYMMQFYAARTHLGISAEFVKEYSWIQLFFVLLRAYAAATMRLPTLLRQRRNLCRSRTISKEEWYRLFSRFKLDAIELALKF